MSAVRKTGSAAAEEQTAAATVECSRKERTSRTTLLSPGDSPTFCVIPADGSVADSDGTRCLPPRKHLTEPTRTLPRRMFSEYEKTAAAALPCRHIASRRIPDLKDSRATTGISPEEPVRSAAARPTLQQLAEDCHGQ